MNDHDRSGGSGDGKQNIHTCVSIVRCIDTYDRDAGNIMKSVILMGVCHRVTAKKVEMEMEMKMMEKAVNFVN